MSVASEKRDTILNTAMRLFSVNGYHATGLNEILKLSGVPKGSLYNYFPNGKEQMALEAMRRSTESRRASITELFARYDNPIDAFLARIDRVIVDLSPPYSEEVLSPYFMMAHELSSINDELRAECQRAYEMRKNIYRDKLLSCGYAPDMAEKLAMTFQMMLNGASEMSVIRKDTVHLSVLREQFPLLLLFHTKIG